MDEEPAGSVLGDCVVAQDVGASAAGTGSSVVVAQSETSSGAHMSRLAQGGVCKMVPATQDWLLMQKSSCLDCFEELLVSPTDEESGRPEWELGWCSTWLHRGCFALGRSMKSELEDLELDAVFDGVGHVPG